jgi:hypothetical protein
VWASNHVVEAAQLVAGGQRLLIEDVERGAADLPRLQRREQCRTVDDRPARGVYDPGVGLHQPQHRAVHQALCTVAEPHVDGDEVGLAEQRLLIDRFDARLGRTLGREVLAPGDHPHAEGLAVAGDQAAQAPEADDAQSGAAQVAAEADLPAAVLERGHLAVEPARRCHEEAPGELRSRLRRGRRAAHRDAEFPGRGHVDRGVAVTGGDQQLQLGQPRQQRPGKRRALAHDAENLEVLKARDQGVRVGEGVVEYGDFGARQNARPVGTFQRHALIVVQERDLHKLLRPARRLSRRRCRSSA